MKKIRTLFFVAIAIVLTSSCCAPIEEDDKKSTLIDIDGSKYRAKVSEFKYRDCEYIAVKFSSEKFGVTHKGNCSNCSGKKSSNDDYWSDY